MSAAGPKLLRRVAMSALGASSLAALFLWNNDEAMASFRLVYAANEDRSNNPLPGHPLPVFPGVEQWNHAKWEPNWDKRDPLHLLLSSRQNRILSRSDYEEEIKKFTPKANRHVILVRHGQYETSGTTDEERKLTSLGKEQASFTGERLKELGLPFELLLNSTMQRAKETSDVIAQHLSGVPRSEDQLLREGAPFPPEPKPKFYAPHEHEFYRDGARIEAAFRKYFHRADVMDERDTYTILVCHANVIRYFVCRALQFPPESWLRFTLKHASITWLMIRPSGSVILHTFGDTGFMPPDKISVT